MHPKNLLLLSKYMIRIFSFVLISFCCICGCQSAYTQNTPGLKLYGNFFNNKKQAIDSVEIWMHFEDRDSLIELGTSSTCELFIPPNKDVLIEFKRRSYFSKKIQVNTKITGDKANRLWTFQFELKLLPEIPGLDTRVFNKPIALIVFDRSLKDFVSNEDYLNSVSEAIQAFDESYIQRIDQYFDELKLDAEKHIKNKKYEDAQVLLNKALLIRPTDTNIPKRIIQIKGLVHKQKVMDRLFYETLAKGEMAFNKQEYKEAKTFFMRARRINPKDSYLNQKIKDVQAIINGSKKVNTTTGNTLDSQYNNLMKLAELAIGRKDFHIARNYLREASKLKPDEAEPILQINAVNKQANALQRKKVEQLGRDFIQANELFEKEEYEMAKILYESLLSDNYRKDYCEARLFDINKSNRVDLDSFVEKLSKEEQFDLYTNLGDSCFVRSQYMNSSEFYQSALELFPASGQTNLKFQKAIERNMGKEEGIANDMFPLIQTKWIAKQIAKKQIKHGLNQFYVRKGQIRVECTVIKSETEQNTYLKIMHSWGGVFYFKMDKSISQMVYREIVGNHKNKVFIN